MAVKLVYKDIALGAAENASVTATVAAESIATPSLLPLGADTGALATCEHNGWGLAHDYKVKGSQKVAYWSREISGADCLFENSPIITLQFSEQFSSTGLTFQFSPGTDDYCTNIYVIWYQNGNIKESSSYKPTSAIFTVEKTVEAFDKIGIGFYATNLPQRRLKLEKITIGLVREFTNKELTGAKFVNEVNLISDTIPVNVLDASFHSTGEAEFLFQKKQAVEAYNGSDLMGVYFIETGEQTGARDYSISCQDAIGVLDLDTYTGKNIWLKDTPCETIIAAVLGGTFDFELDDALRGRMLRGYIPECTKREALQYIAFALMACVDTSGTNKIRFFVPEYSNAKEIPAAETYTGGKINVADTVTEVAVALYTIPGASDNVIEIGDDTYHYDQTYAIAKNPNATAGTPPNKLVFDGCFLCNVDNAQDVADTILAYYMRRKTYDASHVVSGQKMGDFVSVNLPWGGEANGHITKMTVTMSGIVASDTEFLLD